MTQRRDARTIPGHPAGRPPTDEAGFTLIETIIAILILTVGILGWMAFQGSTIRQRTFSRELTRGLQVAQGRLDERAAVVSGWDTSKIGSAACNGTATDTVGAAAYSTRWTSDGDTPMGAAKTFWKVQVETTWRDAAGLTHRVTLDRLVEGK
ncbi:prepilin-type N-terminal cleavage/methylation domain-containing protein [Dissulfurirhabdus thermomarina]|uniref:Prepilin-type N-terminal cleavage/methylation domain-containing protein n=1 Tax=Dissulfurirhabdus thermomarina TaxID=1765737 RepID=A0A6N9TNI6_DISTH|nr:prepilin-type N-terminal cleavage/methylation domain-containing protein [Dissulfurirhabdus thermomarina]NDY42719.1 prepilin-type N-terminal cleavage/methylation domain-containing protein [Dissulfurirhabdus thermomarina]NMX23631.1 prepilin-type N-terminal cleavage/methylation domain-containing protein [Dissulfurirhabdus thermomarina]